MEAKREDKIKQENDAEDSFLDDSLHTQGFPGSLEQIVRGGREHPKDSDLHSNTWSETPSFGARWCCLQEH
ncbi:hypothetical protein TNCV_4966371 [Trichonephila clavipes]|nr:hypothetical protein TNCV_4966371 [Trichonephila clavipes]